MKIEITPMTAWQTRERDVVLARLARHRAADQIVQGTGYDGSRGCAVGCSLDKYDHAEYARVIIGNDARGTGLQLAKLIDRLHERMPLEDAVQWPARVCDALSQSADTTHALSRWFVWLLGDELAPHDKRGQCAKVAALYSRRLSGDEPSVQQWRAAAYAAAADAAAYAYAYAAAAYAGPFAAYAAFAAYSAYSVDSVDSDDSDDAAAACFAYAAAAQNAAFAFDSVDSVVDDAHDAHDAFEAYEPYDEADKAAAFAEADEAAAFADAVAHTYQRMADALVRIFSECQAPQPGKD